MFNFRHSFQIKTVFKFPITPNVAEQKDKRGRRKGWTVDMEILITSAENYIVDHRWKNATSAYYTEQFSEHYRTQEEVVSYFLMHHAPEGEPIKEDEYNTLQAQYEASAKSNRCTDP